MGYSVVDHTIGFNTSDGELWSVELLWKMRRNKKIKTVAHHRCSLTSKVTPTKVRVGEGVENASQGAAKQNVRNGHN
jgi:hypothetical protein